MYLKSIRANGFKSFAENVDIEINKGITGVVGPNGSGKSNIVDAVRWVMGEQSVKALRGEGSMTDVIFAGSKSRNASHRATVSLTFDNQDHYLNSEFNEIEIKRTVYKNGDNEYYINNVKVRLKDITDLFLDSGAGKQSFNIISQGAVADIINSKPEERRLIFEEAAGVLKYKKRKDESFRKLQRTNENLARIELLIEELTNTLAPLKDQAAVAQKYLDYKENLENIEVALIANDITKINDEYELTKNQIKKITNEIDQIDISNSSDNSQIDQLKLLTLKIETEIEEKNNLIMELMHNISELESKKQITIERKKYEVDDNKLQSNIITLKEEILSLKNTIENIKKEISNLEKTLNKKQLQTAEFKKINNDLEEVKNNTLMTINQTNKEILNLQNRIEILKDNIENDIKLPHSVKSIINNIRLSGIHNVLSKLIEVDEKYTMAIETALGANMNIIVVDNEKSAKEAITYLKDNKLGRATFYPLNVIKSRFIEQSTLNIVKNENGFIGIAAELVRYDKKYKDIIYNQLGNVLVVKDIDSLNKIGRLTNYKYRIVSLEGEILYAGGAITGGAIKPVNSVINERQELEKFQKDLQSKKEKLNYLDNELQNNEEKYRQGLLNYEKNERECMILQEQLNQKNEYLNIQLANYNSKNNELEGTKNISNDTIDKELDKILNEYYRALSAKEKNEKELTKLKNEKSDISTKIAELEKNNREINMKYNQKQNQLRTEEVKVGKLEVKLDNLLLLLNENYGLTYERAKNEYELDIDAETARLNVNNLKAKIKDLGDVNLGAINEYERLNTRYNFLVTQKNDLEISVTNLMKIIAEMDEIMKTKFVDTFEKIKAEFKIVFKKLFKGGDGLLELTNKDDLLNTGIEISALPPGKKLNSIALLSGGEKTLTAIALLFAILNVKPVPFVILDEVEAALDDANVDSFGNYLQTCKNKSQFIIITHKKRTMEYTNALYGVTMQESGVSKLVSVRLEEKEG